MDRLQSVQALAIRQVKEWGEIVTGFETRNRYSVSDPATGSEVYFAAEEAGSMLARILLKGLRPFHIAVLTPGGGPAFHIRRPFRFFFHEAAISGTDEGPLGTIVREFSVLRRIYTICDADGSEVCRLFGPILRPWTFKIEINGTEAGKIVKKWSGLLKEGFSDADNFAVEFPPQLPPKARALVLGAVFLIDFVHFENKGNG